MKSKVIISLLLALVMLFALATPALAGKPVGDTLVPNTGLGGAEGAEVNNYECSAKIQVTHTNELKVTVVIKGAIASAEYRIEVHDQSKGWCTPHWHLTTDSRGNARGSYIMQTPTPYADGETANLSVYLLRGVTSATTRLWWETYLPVDF